jgi:pyruvate/2-oxoglutarate dehydrogenase complex dihydrolipoamide dehydrogenase (E3) component
MPWLRATYAENDRARAGRDGMGLVKLILNRQGKILGAGIVGTGAGELAALFGLAMAQGLEARKLASLAAPHPSHADLARALGEQAAANGPPDAWQARRLAFNRLLP